MEANTFTHCESSPKYVKVRWVATLPIALAASLLGPTLVYIFDWLGSSADPSRLERFFLLTAQSAAMGAAFVWAATYVAPTHKEKVAMIFAGVAVFIFGGMAVLFATTEQWINVVHVVISAIAAGYTGYVLHESRAA